MLIVPVPSGGEVEVIATKARMCEEAFEYHQFEGRYVRALESFRTTLSIP